MLNEILNVFEKIKQRMPWILGLALFDRDGFMLVSLMDFPDYDRESTAAFHADLWQEIKKFTSVLPKEIDGSLKSLSMELDMAYLQMKVIGEYGIMVAIKKEKEMGAGALRKIINEIARRIFESTGK